jgi:hypothetical protein
LAETFGDKTQMKEDIEKAIKLLAGKGSDAVVKSDDALKYTQAALNLAHVLATLNLNR